MKEFSQKYLLLNKLAEGASGIVYKAQDLIQPRLAAIKILKAELHQETESLERFRREILAINRLMHPSAVNIFEQGQLLNGNPWIAMELLQGVTLEEKIEREGALSARELRVVLSPVCELLAEAHEKGIVHRDLKAHHIILTEGSAGELVPRVIDFGLAFLQDAETLTQSGIMAGSPQYMPPEQWDGLHNTDARSDIYSLGMIAYQCLAGRLPFEADTLLDWMKRHFHELPTPLSQSMQGRPLSASVESAVMKAIAKEPAARQQSVAELSRGLFG